MRPVGRQPQHHVARLDGAAVDDVALLDDADREAREIVLAALVHARHLGGLAPDQRAARLLAAGGNALDDLGRGRHVELAAGVVVEEEQRLGALGEYVVDAHRHEIDAYRVVAPDLQRELQLGAHPVGARDQHRLAVIARDLEQRPETPDAGEHAFAQRFPGERLDVFDEFVPGVEVHAGVAVGESFG